MEDRNNSRIIAIIYSLIGALIGTIPWVLVYVYGNLIVAILAIIIAMLALKGYKMAKGKIDKYTPLIIVIVSLLAVTIATFIFIPVLLLLKEGSKVSIDILIDLYKNGQYVKAILGDYAISLLFALLGISGVIANIRNEVNPNAKNDLRMYTVITKEEGNKVREVFEKADALEKYNAKTKDEILSLFDDENAQILFYKYLNHNIIKRYKGKYYFSEKALNNPGKNAFKRFIKIFLVVSIGIIILSTIIIIFVSDDDNDNYQKEYEENVENVLIKQDNIIKYYVPSNWVEVPKFRKERIYYYTPTIDKTGYNGVISVSYGVTEYGMNEYELFKKALKESYIDNIDEDAKNPRMNEFTNNTGYKVVEIVIDYEDPTYPCTEYMYYVFDDKAYGLVYLTDYYSRYVNNIKDVVYTIVNDYEFIKGEEEL